mmetsp:Transcript_10793/g.15906  ORF Transcript_10793/g.15906 Transcript_10793/m.15906 type:complete len:198 (+) Transcript_10793:34-627(+)|eukprot:CAMPEP_0194201938 /NCGR_PEP_ID=MMETSP0156-20130528/2088_1 /TAXON_ID=33649 /ORGANISM="Thalassionema nitzschioides, Strain L26-B" /LENGTH=197 /DNA_ID=CAMNT_0038927277 /DNA_START=24 /DNA_END=617 /DNA_ORIENTATION=+
MTSTPSSTCTLLPPRLISTTQDSPNGLEASVHTLPKPLIREFRHVFGDKYLESGEDLTQHGDCELLAIPTNQHALHDLVGVGDEIEREKDRLLNVFLEFGKDLTSKLRSKGLWADYIDPCSGLPMVTLDCNKVYSEVDGMECLLNYKAYNAGFCKILTHPKWGSSVYPGTIFCYAPPQLVMDMLNQYPAAKTTNTTK